MENEKPEFTAEVFAERRRRADRQAFDRLMRRRTGQPLRAGDEIPPTKGRSARR